ncbi:MAG: HIT family protein [Rhizobiaceae bacterium]
MTSYDETNIFAKILRGELPCEKVYEDEDTIAIMDIMPRGDGHCLVLPKAPARTIFDIESSSYAAVAKTTQLLAKACKQAFGADGITIQQFNEAAGGQIVFHLHVHIIPRHEGIKMRPHSGTMEKSEIIKANADKIRAVLSAN